MNLKESFRYQNKLESFLQEALFVLRDPDNITKTKETQLRRKANPDAEDETTIIAAESPYADHINCMTRFVLFLLSEKETLFAAIRKAKNALPVDIDSEVSLNVTRQAVAKLFDLGCPLVILACNTASAKALRTIQQHDLPQTGPTRRVFGIIRPTAEVIGNLTKSRHVGVLATEGTIKSESYNLEIRKLHPDIQVTGVACPLWVPLVEYNEADSPGADYFVKKRIDQLMRQDPMIDAIILGCTHYPLLMPKILKYIPTGVRIVPQGEYVADSLNQYLQRHADIESQCSKGGSVRYLTTENPDNFSQQAQLFLHEQVSVEKVSLF